MTDSLRRCCAIGWVSIALNLVGLARGEDQRPNAIAFKVPPGWKAELYAAEPQLANPVAFCLDERGRVYVAEEYRFNRGTEENRTRPFLLEDDLQLQSLDDRLAMFRKWADRFEGGMGWFNRYSDQVRLLEDRDGDGRADHSAVFAGGFNGTLDGLAAGVIARDGDVYLTCIPNLWRLRDNDGDRQAEQREAIHTGFGVNAAFLGHDLHGLTWGPDGRLYFSVGDRGFHVRTREGKLLHGPRTGAVFRCDPDGSNLEVVARGLRNPQELDFDDFGRLFAVDNNCDKGDYARLVYVVEGGDSGWNMSYQTIPEPYLTGPWHAEQIWYLPEEAKGRPAWTLPPVGKLGPGPSGFAAYPGVGLPDRYAGHFFYCNFTTKGGVESFAVRPKGAGFEVTDFHPVATPVMATDVDFGYDGKMYLSEFGRLEWDGSNKEGRIYTVIDPESHRASVVKQVEALFRVGFAGLPLLDLEEYPGTP
ncbi:MAG: PVC-type heme-binding CxxCH protein [Isosphaeraceae bacterium]